MLSGVTFGQYFPGASPLHKMDPRVKIILLIVQIVMIFLSSNLVALGIVVLSVFVLIGLAGVPVRMYARTLKSIWLIIALTAVLNAVYVSGHPLLNLGFVTITREGLIRAGFMAARIILLIVTSAILTYTTTPTALTDAIESLLSPLKHIGLGEQVHTLAMMMTIALRFIPTLMEETDKIMSAQKARGSDTDSGNLLSRVRALLPILVPLLVSSFRRAHDLADAMECRCYTGGKGRTRMKQLHATRLDYVAAAVFLVVAAAVVCSCILLPSLLT